jgi:hypothetical protein
MNKLKLHSPNLTQENIARIRELFPGCVTEVGDDPQITHKNADSIRVEFEADARHRG